MFPTCTSEPISSLFPRANNISALREHHGVLITRGLLARHQIAARQMRPAPPMDWVSTSPPCQTLERLTKVAMAVAPVATEASLRRIRQPPEKAVRLQRRWWRAVATGSLVKAPEPAAPAGPAVQAAVVAVMLAARRCP